MKSSYWTLFRLALLTALAALGLAIWYGVDGSQLGLWLNLGAVVVNSVSARVFWLGAMRHS